MSTLREKKNNAKSLLEAIKRLNDDNRKSTDIYNTYVKDLIENNNNLNKRYSDLTSNFKKRQTNKDIFSDLLDFVETFVGVTKTVEYSNSFANKQKIKQITIESIENTLKKVNQILINNVNNYFFIGDGICGTDKEIETNELYIYPNEFDFTNVLRVDPNTNSGKILYEDDTDRGFIKMNKLLYNTFTSGQEFILKNDNSVLFRISWDDENQRYIISDLNQTITKMDEFVYNYYSNIEFLNISEILKSSMLLTIHGDGSENILFKKGLNNLNRLLNKILINCGEQKNNDNQNQINDIEQDEDFEDYFEFNEIDNVYFEGENDIYERVIRFKDCDNIEINLSTQHIEDFVFQCEFNEINNVINDTLMYGANECYEFTDRSQPFDTYHLSLITDYIKNLPKSLIGVILSPKYIFPLVVLYKSIYNTYLDIKELMKKISKFFVKLIKEIFWEFITYFWKLIKKELLLLLTKFSSRIIKNKLKRQYILISSLLSLLKRLQSLKLTNCDDLYSTITKTIENTINGVGGGKFRIPGVLLSVSDLKPGQSVDRIFIDIIQKLEKNGINTGQIYGEQNKLVDLIKSLLEGIETERDKNGYITATNKLFIGATSTGDPITIPPGSIKIVGVNV